MYWDEEGATASGRGVSKLVSIWVVKQPRRASFTARWKLTSCVRGACAVWLWALILGFDDMSSRGKPTPLYSGAPNLWFVFIKGIRTGGLILGGILRPVLGP